MVLRLFRNQDIGVRFPVLARMVRFSPDTAQQKIVSTGDTICATCLHSSSAEHFLGKEEVVGPIPTGGSGFLKWIPLAE